MGSPLLNKSRDKRKKLISDINITPFVDVLLVLLIIFMIAAPMLTGSVDVDLPQGASEHNQERSQPIIATINKKGEIFLQDQEVKLSLLNARLAQITNNDFGHKIYLKADKKIDYGRVMNVIKNLNQGGFRHVILVTDLTK